jgi:hypothetical protein
MEPNGNTVTVTRNTNLYLNRHFLEFVVSILCIYFTMYSRPGVLYNLHWLVTCLLPVCISNHSLFIWLYLALYMPLSVCKLRPTLPPWMYIRPVYLLCQVLRGSGGAVVKPLAFHHYGRGFDPRWGRQFWYDRCQFILHFAVTVAFH